MNKKHVVITGAGSGLGASLAHLYADKGYHVTLMGRNSDKLQKVAASLGTSDYSIHVLDVSSYTAVTTVFRDIRSVDLLINNAGVGYFELAEALSVEQVDAMIDINLKGTIFCTQQVLPAMKAAGAGQIINIVSTAGLEGKVTESVYCASKFGVKGFTESLQKELAETGIRVSGIYMGGMATPFWDGVIDEDNMGGMMAADDVAEIIVNSMEERRNINVSELVIRNH
ncbi:SDR family oxidoreductase [Fundicoccus culcitae]|uniref:SDR family NAD(P)-dependent oxidoreductase n=1 Tax=Fundicoccus culcitae TaxID=2969821 RepID=A0ABY5P965_9LACT|nr:SDR family NAD(P)-dependent oxidoreductase [Fundicoccus culcitae]UUX35131.1 SDR family NAD(P)-dependent oxidoreductase [Fundicoccus culcitae]